MAITFATGHRWMCRPVHRCILHIHFRYMLYGCDIDDTFECEHKKWTEMHCIHWNDNSRKTEKQHIVQYKVWSWNELERVEKWWIVVDGNWIQGVWHFSLRQKLINFLFDHSFRWLVPPRTISIEITNKQMNEWMIKRSATALCEFFDIFWTSLAGKSCLCDTVFIVDLKKYVQITNVRIPRESPKLKRYVFRLDFICRISMVLVPEIDHNICVKICVSNANLHFASHFYCH